MAETSSEILSDIRALHASGRWRSIGLFFAQFLRNPRLVGAVAPSSRFLARKMLEGLDLNPGVRIVEFGPGTGSFTSEIFHALPGDGQFLGIERERAFVEILRERFTRGDFVLDSVVRIREIADTRGLLPVDHIISGLPFASLPPRLTLEVLDGSGDVLRPGGTFTTFQYLHAYHFASARTFRVRMAERFGPIRQRCLEWRNLPPAYVFTWQKPVAAPGGDGDETSNRECHYVATQRRETGWSSRWLGSGGRQDSRSELSKLRQQKGPTRRRAYKLKTLRA